MNEIKVIAETHVSATVYVQISFYMFVQSIQTNWKLRECQALQYNGTSFSRKEGFTPIGPFLF